MSKEKKRNKHITVAVSGGFDPLHIGHVRMFEEAKKLGDKLVAILNNDNWLIKKKGYAFMPETERAELIKSLAVVDDVMLTFHDKDVSDRSVCAELRKLKPDVFANGGDRTFDNIPEVPVCDEIGCKMIFGIGKGGKVQSSSWLTDKVARKKVIVKKPWGEFENFEKEATWNLKTITIDAGQRLSLQSHKKRDEVWVLVEGKALATVADKKIRMKPGDVIRINKKQKHRIESGSGAKLVEVGLGDFDENDIVRYEDDYGRA
jgi:D-beta-D-heptose 7-phosphate kinase/D-beta-D-heptose 1-phosphate adenosyltransferase